MFAFFSLLFHLVLPFASTIKSIPGSINKVNTEIKQVYNWGVLQVVHYNRVS